MKYTGDANVTIAGGDEMWLYINGNLVLEIISDPASPDTVCKKINIAAAGNIGQFHGRLQTLF